MMKNMPKVGVFTGLVLVALGVGAYLGSGRESVTALIPAFFGIPLVLTSALSFNEKLLKMGMHIAATIGLLGFIAPLGRLISVAIKGKFEMNMATSCMIGMSIVCLLFVLLCVKSFIDVRKARNASAS